MKIQAIVCNFANRGILYWLRIPRIYEDMRVDEWTFALSRLTLSISFLIEIIFESGARLGMCGTVLPLYFAYSLLIMIVLRLLPRWHPYLHIAVHGMDILWAAHIMLLVPWSPILFLSLLLVAASAAFRYGFWESVLSMAVLFVALLAGTEVYRVPTTFIYRDGLIGLAMGILVGFLAESKAFRIRSYNVSRLVEEVRKERDLTKALVLLSTTTVSLYQTKRLMVGMQNQKTGRALAFDTADERRQISEIGGAQEQKYFFPAPACWRVVNRGRAGAPRLRCFAMNGGKITRQNAACSLPNGFLESFPFRRLLSVSAELKEGWTVRIFAIDPLRLFGGNPGLRHLYQSATSLQAAFESILLMSRIKMRAQAGAAGRIARELHDGSIQSLAAIVLQIELLRNQTGEDSGPIADSLARIRKNIANELAALREYTQDLRSFEIEPEQFVGHLAGIATRFQCEHGIETHFISDEKDVRLQPHVCGELARIAQEALVNIRKHSGASKVLMRFARGKGNWILSIMDNGRGFHFSGYRSHEEMQSAGVGPSVIMERARKIGGTVTVQSARGEGATVEIVLAAD
jgi:signal transduction histidine kinase